MTNPPYCRTKSRGIALALAMDETRRLAEVPDTQSWIRPRTSVWGGTFCRRLVGDELRILIAPLQLIIQVAAEALRVIQGEAADDAHSQHFRMIGHFQLQPMATIELP